jgi:hypothetical protein
MAYDSKPAWSGVFVAPATSGHPSARRHEPTTGPDVTTGPSVKETTDEFLEAVDDGSARDRYGRRFNSEAAGELSWSLRGHFGEMLGAMSLDGVRRRDVEGLVYELSDSGISRRRLRALAKSVRALYDYAVEQDLVRHNPAERIAIPDEDEAEQPTSGHATRMDSGPESTTSHRAISLALHVATLGFMIIALIFLAGSL